MSTFDLKKFLTENKLTRISQLKEVDEPASENFMDAVDEVEIEEEEVIEPSEGETSDISKYLSFESAEDIIKEIETDISRTTFEAKLSKMKEVITAIDEKVNSLEEDTSLSGFVNTGKIKEMKRMVKKLRGMEEKYSKEYSKKYGKE